MSIQMYIDGLSCIVVFPLVAGLKRSLFFLADYFLSFFFFFQPKERDECLSLKGISCLQHVVKIIEWAFFLKKYKG